MSIFDAYVNGEDAFIIAEVGQNHQGSLETALEYVREFAKFGADAIKFQCRNNKVLFDKEAYSRKYFSENAFGETYGQHREFLELTANELKLVRDECRRHNVYFMATPFDEPSLEMLVDIEVDILKIASFDLGNLPFIKLIAETRLPVVVSVGGGRLQHIQSSVELLLRHHDDLSILHCVSEYPTPLDRVGLDNIRKLKQSFPKKSIGLSDHFNGTLTGPVGYMYGARVFEKHVTFDRSLKGTDHSFALEPGGFVKFVRDIKRVPKMAQTKSQETLGQEDVFKKLGKSIVANKDMSAGELLTIENLTGKIFTTTSIPVRDLQTIFGRTLKVSVRKGEPIQYENLK
jgi:sialic acid synthase